MNNKRKIALLMAMMVALLAFSSPCWGGQAGKFAKALSNRFCGETQGAMYYGCAGYMHYRVDLVKDKNGAKSSCYKNGCNNKYGNSTSPFDMQNCYKGCDNAYDADN